MAINSNIYNNQLQRCFHGCIILFICVVLQANKSFAYSMNNVYSENLPADCPPAQAEAVDNVRFYRFVKTNPATDEDFISHKKKFPKRKFNVSDCEALSISVFKVSELLDFKKLPTFKNSIMAIVTITIADGLVMPSGENEHHSWWRSSNFTIGGNITY